ncbi:MAG TPA: hypothetical protein PKL21_11240, partial [Anaerolineaceae bacterium]|nr:hypothetical protein [Anaerolineaceae bacterium]
SRLANASGMTSSGNPYLRVFLPFGVLLPDQSVGVTLLFDRQPQAGPPTYALDFLSGQGNP